MTTERCRNGDRDHPLHRCNNARRVNVQVALARRLDVVPARTSCSSIALVLRVGWVLAVDRKGFPSTMR